jgi:cell cycle sensor histidine kinase DivJ
MTGPLMAAILASRTGSLERAQILHLFGLTGAVAALALSGVAPGALALLAVLPADAGFSASRRAVWLTALAGALLLALCLVLGAPAPGLTGLAPFVAAGGAYAAWLAYAQRAVHGVRRRLAEVGEARHRLLADAVGDLVMGCDKSGSVAFASAGGTQTFGLTQRDVAGRGFFERLHVLDRPAYLAATAQAAAGERTVTTLVRLRVGASAPEADGYMAPVFAWAELRCRAADPTRIGAAAGVVVVARDVSELRAHADELEALRARAVEESAWKDRFLANVSHELRTPLNAVIGFSDIMRGSTPIDAARRVEYAGIIHDAGEHLLAMVNSLLDVSKLDAGRFEIAPETVALPSLVEQVVEMMRLRAEQGGVSLRATIDPRAAELVADKRAVRQIVTNLVSNAVKFTREGGAVELLARPEGNSVAIEVVDTGVGIAAGDLARLGDAFFQVSKGYDRSHEGTGLGLSLVRGLVGLHGGTIAIESAPGEGTRVIVKLPLDCRCAREDVAPARIETISRRGPATPATASVAAALDLLRKTG